MKKLMIGAAVCAAVFGLKAEIASANIVGYSTVNAGSYPNITGGMCFRTVGASGDTFKLKDLKLSGATYMSDWIQFIDPLTSIVDVSKNASYYSYENSIADGSDGSDAGWYGMDASGNEEDRNEAEFAVGTAFLASFLSQNVTVQFSGEVLTETNLVVDCSGKPNSYIANAYPGDLVAGDLVLENAVYMSDWLQFIDPATSIVDVSKNISYYSYENSIADGSDGSDAGWYGMDSTGNEEDRCMQAIPAGSGFLCSFLSTGVKVVFPKVQ